MSQPFYQPARQNFSSSQSMQQPQGGFGGFGGGQMPQQNWGGGQGFSGFGGGQGFNFGGGQAFGGFQQQQFNPFQGGFGGGFSPFQGGFGGGFNPMFGGIGGLGFNPMMGPQFGMPMGGFGIVEDRPTPQASILRPDGRGGFYDPNQQRVPMGGFGGMGAAAAQAQRTPIQFEERMPTEQDWNLHAASVYAPNADMEAMKRDFMSRPMRTPRNLDALFGQPTADQPQQLVQASPESIARVQQFQRQFMYGGLGSLGFNPMMGPQFGMPMKQVQRSQYENPQQRQVAEAEKARWASLTPEQRSDENNALRARFQQEYSPIMGPQFGMPMQQLQAMLQGQQLQAPMEDWQQQQIRQFGRLSHNPYTGAQY